MNNRLCNCYHPDCSECMSLNWTLPKENKIRQFNDIDYKIGQLIKSKRKIIGMTQLELSEAVGLSRPSIANIEVGKQGIMMRDIYSFAKALNFIPSDFFK